MQHRGRVKRGEGVNKKGGHHFTAFAKPSCIIRGALSVVQCVYIQYGAFLYAMFVSRRLHTG